MKVNILKKGIQYLAMLYLIFCSYAFIVTPSTQLNNNNKMITAEHDSVIIKKNIITFLRWYKANLHTANNFPLLIKDSKGYYALNEKASTAYLNYLKSSKLVSVKYIGYWKTYFDDKAIMLKKDKIKTDVPEGFDFDFVLITQEPEVVLNKIDSLVLNTITLTKNTAVVGIKLPTDQSVEYEFEMIKTTQGWQIEYISTANYD